MEYWTVTLEVWTPDEVWRVDFETRFAHGEAFGVADADDAIQKAREKATGNGFRVIKCEEMKLCAGAFDN